VTICILAILFGLGGAYALRVYLKEKPAPVVTQDQTTVPIASLDLPAGRLITRGDIGLSLRRTMGQLPPHTMASPVDIIGRVLSAPMKAGETFQTTNLFPEGGGPNLAERIKPGMRAVTIPVDSLGTLGGYVRQGCVVDVLFRATSRQDKQGFEEIPEVTVTLLEGVEVLAVGQDPLTNRTVAGPRRNTGSGDVASRETPKSYVTVACSLDQSSKLRAVLGHGELALAMQPQKAEQPIQNVIQVQQTKPSAVTLENILGVDQSPKQAKTEVYRGGNRTTNVFDIRKHRATLVNVVVDEPRIPPKETVQIPAPPTDVAGAATTTAPKQN
jgi:Flp pilus assembly protein CpaB